LGVGVFDVVDRRPGENQCLNQAGIDEPVQRAKNCRIAEGVAQDFDGRGVPALGNVNRGLTKKSVSVWAPPR
jgi:hypothetical protein